MSDIPHSKPKAYVPPGAQINLDKKGLLPPPVEYEDVEVVFDINAVKDLTNGQYGKKEE